MENAITPPVPPAGERSKPALDLLEEAFHVLRTAPTHILIRYYLGSLPFILALLFFWADMSKSPFAPEHLIESSLGLAIFFTWMKCWQASFVFHLKSFFTGTKDTVLPRKRILRLIFVQTVMQPAGLFLIPFAFLLFLPFGWIYAYY